MARIEATGIRYGARRAARDDRRDSPSRVNRSHPQLAFPTSRLSGTALLGQGYAQNDVAAWGSWAIPQNSIIRPSLNR
jgi:hypothetical protein